ncbi:ribosome-assembly protein 3-domain-containing protein [Ilyonectria robusta]|uniref:ribosome-assembly protein 3-domain-containing protein n=1 Tax=Ilyonectria robusta TaxID=1079257 RepID=UPI001E8CC629|nr:ribosome-assembly protein 3-domain-containing protein [Ilyonectria robusta]KAH8670462.1 ribosome-assembly protein 3-domain-containing protein [Ilyonectria robusta]
MSGKADSQREAEFSSYYLQRTTQELSEDLDKVRTADDFKADSIPFLVHALQQGAGLFSAEDQKRVVTASKSDKGENA